MRAWTWRAGRSGAIAIAAALCVAATAHADVRFAAPDASASAACAEADPCEIEVAIEGAQPGDVVRVLPGYYETTDGSDPITIPSGVIVEGGIGEERPVIDTPGFDGSGSEGEELHDVIVLHGYQDVPGVNRVDLVERVEVLGTATASNKPCVVGNGGAMRDSICLSLAYGATALTVDHDCTDPEGTTAEITNVTAVAIHDAQDNTYGVHVRASSACESRVLLENVIAQGHSFDIWMHNDGPAKLTLETANSLYEKQIAFSGEQNVLDEVDRVTQPALFPDLPDLDLSQAPGSPSIDRGRGDGLGRLDVYGNARVQGGRIDIGAQEFDAAPTVILTKPRAKRFVVGKRKRFKRVRVAFTADELSNFECKLDRRPWAPCESGVRFKLKAKRRKGALHTIRVRATDMNGNRSVPAVWRGRVVQR